MARVAAVALPLIVLGTIVALVVGATPAERQVVSPGPAGPVAGFPRTVNAEGGPTVVPARPVRIVSCSLSADEILVELVDLDRLHAVTRLATDASYSFVSDRLAGFPPERLVADVKESNERMLAWQPDLLIVTPWTDAAFVAQMADAGIPVVCLYPATTLDDVRTNIRLLARATGADDAGAALLANIDRRVVAARSVPADPVRALYLTFYGEAIGTVAAGASFTDCMQLAGLENVAWTVLALDGFPPIVFEQLAWLDESGQLDALVVPLAKGVDVVEQLRALPGADQLAVLSEGRVITIPARLTHTTSHHMVAAIEHLAAARATLAD